MGHLFKKIESEDDLLRIFPLIRQLRKHLTEETFMEHYASMSFEEYELWSYEENQKSVGLIGMRVCTDFVRGTHLYVDDLVTDEEHRSQGIGAKLLNFAEEEAKKRNLPSLRLACVIENASGLKFYEREGWIRRSYNLVKKSES